MGVIPLKLEKAMIRKMPREGSGDFLGDVASIASSAASDLAGLDGMIPVQWDKDEMHFKFNPTELTMNASAQVRTEPSRSTEEGKSPTQQYIGVNSRTLSFTVFLDEWEAPAGQDVSKMVDTLAGWTEPESQAKGPPQPPKAMLVWGEFKFEGIIKSVNARYTLFRRDGTPARAEVQVQMQRETEGAK